MARPNPLKKNRKKHEWSVLAVGEGDTERAFLMHLKNLYGQRNLSIGIKLVVAGGGSPKTIVKKSIKKMELFFYDAAFTLLDTDVPWPDGLEERAAKKGLRLIGSEPCIEGLLLRILDKKYNVDTWSSKKCKQQLHAKYIDARSLLQPQKYGELFSRDVIDGARGRLAVLDDILRMMFERGV